MRQRATEFFEHEPASGVSPFEAVAVGAAIQAYAMTDALEDDAGVPTRRRARRREVARLPRILLGRAHPRASPSLTTGASPRAAPAGLPGSLAVPVPGSVPVAGSPPVAPHFTIEKPAAAAQPRARIGWLAAAVLVAALLVAWLLFR